MNEKSPPPLGSLEEKLWTRGVDRKHPPPGQEKGPGKLRRDRWSADLTDRHVKKNVNQFKKNIPGYSQ